MASSTVQSDDQFFANCLDFVPRRFVVPLTDAEKEKLHERSLPKKTGSATSATPTPTPKSASKQGTPTPRGPRKPNALLIEEAFAREKKEAQQTLQRTNTVASNASTVAAAAAASTSASNGKPEVATVADLRARLQLRVEENRKRAGTPGARAERDKLLPPKQKKARVVVAKPAEEEEGGGEAKQPSAAAKDKKEEAAVVEEKKEKKAKKPVADAAAEEDAAPKPAAAKAPKATAPAAVDAAPAAAAPSSKKAKKQTIEEKISYGALRIDEDRPKGDSSTSTSSILNVKKLIKKAQDGQARMEQLKEQGKDHVVQEERWDQLEKKASGEKVRDDPKLLKKALKSLEKKKEKASKARKERTQHSDADKKERIAQREKNIKDRSKLQIQKRSGGRIQANLDGGKGGGKGGKGGDEASGRRGGGGGGAGGGGNKARPGFEGRKPPPSKRSKTE